jgi:hypothetical protein
VDDRGHLFPFEDLPERIAVETIHFVEPAISAPDLADPTVVSLRAKHLVVSFRKEPQTHF